MVANDKRLFNYLYEEKKKEKELIQVANDIELPNRSIYERTLIQKKQRKDDVIDNLKRISFKEPCEEEVAKKLLAKSQSYMDTINAELTAYPVINKKSKGNISHNSSISYTYRDFQSNSKVRDA
jgi:hypothetical protein